MSRLQRWQVNDGTAVAQLLSYCDGDVNNIQGLHAYDDARYKMTGSGFQQYVTVTGGNHNYYNSDWTPGSGFPASDDWTGTSDPFCGTVTGNGRLMAIQQRAVATAYLPAFFRSEVGGEWALKSLIDGSGGLAPSVSTFNLHVTYHGADTQRRDLNRLLNSSDLTTNFLGGATTPASLSPYDLCGGDLPQPQHCLSNQSTARQPHIDSSALSSLRGLSQLRMGWSALGSRFANDIPAPGDRDISEYQFFQFRSTVNFTDTRNAKGQAEDFSVRFSDEFGATQSLRIGQFSKALFYPPGTTGALLMSDLHFYKPQVNQLTDWNVALQATASASSDNPDAQQTANKAIDGVVDGYQGVPGDYTKEWATSLGGPGSWIRLDWSAPQVVTRVVLYDRPNSIDHVLSGTVTFSDRTSINVGALDNSGGPMTMTFPPKTISSLTFTINSCDFHNIGLSEIQVFGIQ